MNAYVYRADLHCAPCGERIMTYLEIDSGDSDDYPQGPYPNGGGEADTPQHCGTCGVFLENPLTDDGVEYVREASDGPVVELWREFYASVL